ncbi:MAG: lipid-A-disaccharide synthase [Saprospiraceae bacterium]|nr:lipid-A-disaccharide synthase [Saprospiraceae bacterium]
MELNIFILAGEASGDLHGANLAGALKAASPGINLHGWGGPKMEAQGVVLHRRLKDLSFMGFVEVIRHLRTIRKNFSLIKKFLTDHRPDALVLIDYPGFNLKIAKWAHSKGIRVFYFISPTVWAWKANRVFTIKDSVERLYCILPFEVDFYKKYNYEVTYVGNPLLDSVAAFTPNQGFRDSVQFADEPYIAVLPGSRMQELSGIFPVMVRTMAMMPRTKFIIARTSMVDLRHYKTILESLHPEWQTHISIATDQTYDTLHHASSAMVTSGTATLETALLRIPQVVCYKTNPLNFRIAKIFVNIKYISLVNLIPDKPILKELIQSDLTPDNLFHEIKKIEEDKSYRQRILSDYDALIELMGQPGVSRRMAADLLRRINNR